MRKLILTTTLATLMGASVALAIPQSGTIVVTETPGSHFSDGGQFTATVGSESFQTFCIEINYVFTPGATYDYTLGQATHSPQIPPTAAKSLTLGAAWLFSQFTSGAFGSLFLSPTDAGQLQAAIWFFQNQGPNPNGAFTPAPYYDGLPGNYYTDLALAALPGTSAYKPSNEAYGVEVIQSADANGKPAQDWLYVPDGGTTIMMLGLGLTVLTLVSRRFAVAR